MRLRGLVMEVKKDSLVLLSPTGEFRQVPLPGRVPRVGEEIEVRVGSQWTRPLAALVAAALLLVALGGIYLQPWMEPVGYVALDINPSLGIYLDKDQRVVRAEGLNQEGKELLREVKVRGKELNHALGDLVQGAVGRGYIQPGMENIIMTSLVSLRQDALLPELDVLAEAVNTALDGEYGALVVVQAAGLTDLEAARQEKLSLNEHLLRAKAQEAGKPLPATPSGETSLGQALQDGGTSIEEILASPGLPPGWEQGQGPGQQVVVLEEGVVVSAPPGLLKKWQDTDDGSPGLPGPSEGENGLPPGLSDRDKGLPPGLSDREKGLPPGLSDREEGPPVDQEDKEDLPPGREEEEEGFPPGREDREGELPPGQEEREEGIPPGQRKGEDGLPPGLEDRDQLPGSEGGPPGQRKRRFQERIW